MFSFQGMDKREIVVALAGLYRRQVYIAAAVIVSVTLLMKSALPGVGAGIVWSAGQPVACDKYTEGLQQDVREGT